MYALAAQEYFKHLNFSPQICKSLLHACQQEVIQLNSDLWLKWTATPLSNHHIYLVMIQQHKYFQCEVSKNKPRVLDSLEHKLLHIFTQ